MQKFFLFIVVLTCYSCQRSVEKIQSPKISQPPNILFIEVDDLTAKYLGFFGADFAKTPCLDEFAATGVVFDNAVVQGTMCTPSRNSLITGRYPHELDLYENLDLKHLPKGIWTFPKALQKEGYKTFWVGKNHLIPDTRGIKAESPLDLRNKGLQIEMGFDDIFQSLGRSFLIEVVNKQIEKEGHWVKGIDAYADFLFENNLLDTFLQEGYVTPTSLDPDTEYMDGYFTSIAIEKMEKYKEDAPFFMWVNFSGPHPPFNAPMEYMNMFEAKNMPAAIDPNSETFDIPKELKSSPLPDNVTATFGYRKVYMASVAYMDSQVGRLLNFINTSRFHDNTIIVFFSDHGIMLGDHGLVGKYTLYKEVLNPALVVSYPKEYKAQRVKTAVELLDLGKTILDIAGASEETIGEAPNGNSLSPLLKGTGQFTGNGIGFSEMRGLRSSFNGDYKYIDHPETPILFNLKIDPDETQNMLEKEPEIATFLKNASDQLELNTPQLKVETKEK